MSTEDHSHLRHRLRSEVLLKSDAFCVMRALRRNFSAVGAQPSCTITRANMCVRELRLLTHRLLGAAFDAGVPVYTSSPGDSTIGMNVAVVLGFGGQPGFDPEVDVNETTAIVYGAKTSMQERGAHHRRRQPQEFHSAPSRTQEIMRKL
ncbi:hypothetical protein [Candidatus Amarolinea dominans]|uniref:hypothetical protein n=1 Tax=Candidatus Amarolinea dominans TaxID=3140696 RepID=UPI001D5C2D77|nr:hypothetical protein [Anaerolineae bacterium]